MDLNQILYVGSYIFFFANVIFAMFTKDDWICVKSLLWANLILVNISATRILEQLQ